MSKQQKQFKGAAALLTTIIVGLIFIVIVAGLTSLTNNETKRSVNIDQSARAYLAANSGIDRAVSLLQEGIISENKTCDEDGSNDPIINEPIGDNSQSTEGTSFDILIDCVIITKEAKDQFGFLPVDQYATYKLIGDDNPVARKISLEYNDIAVNSIGKDKAFDCGFTGEGTPLLTLDDASTCTYDGPATFALTLAWWEKAGINGEQVTLREPNLQVGEGVIYSTSTVVTPGGIDLNEDSQSWGITDAQHNCVEVSATELEQGSLSTDNNPALFSASNTDFSDENFSCHLAFDISNVQPIIDSGIDFGNLNYILTVKPLYQESHYRLRFLDSDNNAIETDAAQAMILATGKSGDVYRKAVALRTVEFLPVSNVFDQAIFSGSDLCKNMVVTQSGDNAITSNPNYSGIEDGVRELYNELGKVRGYNSGLIASNNCDNLTEL